MSDRSYFQLLVEGPATDEAALHALIENELGIGAEGERRWSAEDANTAFYQEVASRIIDRFPEVSFECWNDPAYDYLGGLVMYTPELGRWEGECDSDGNAVLTASQIKGLPMKKIHEAAGIAWSDRLAYLRELNRVTTNGM